MFAVLNPGIIPHQQFSMTLAQCAGINLGLTAEPMCIQGCGNDQPEPLIEGDFSPFFAAEGGLWQ